MMNTNMVDGLEDQLADARELLERRDIALRLSNNRDFRVLILEGFCSKDAARLASESGDPSLTPQQRADAMAMAQAGGHLKRFLSAAFQMGAIAGNEIGDIEQALVEARAEADMPEVHGTLLPGSRAGDPWPHRIDHHHRPSRALNEFSIF